GVNGISQTAGGGYGLVGNNPFGVNTVGVPGGAYSYSTGSTANGLSFSQTVTLGPNDSFFNVSVTLKNTTNTAMNKVVYATGVDPDPDIGFSGAYVTNNTITGSGASTAVSAYGTVSHETITLSNTSVGGATSV